MLSCVNILNSENLIFFLKKMYKHAMDAWFLWDIEILSDFKEGVSGRKKKHLISFPYRVIYENTIIFISKVITILSWMLFLLPLLLHNISAQFVFWASDSGFLTPINTALYLWRTTCSTLTAFEQWQNSTLVSHWCHCNMHFSPVPKNLQC